MKPKRLNVKHLWKQFADVLFPRLRLSIIDRVVYSHLVRHTRLEGKLQLRFSIPWLARGIGISSGPVREAVRRLIVLGALRLIHRSKAGHVIEVRLPDEIRAARPGLHAMAGAIAVGGRVNASRSVKSPVKLEQLDFLKTRALRQSIHLRERGHCFYCLRRIDSRVQCLDHVIPRVKAGRNSYRNLVSCCLECNSLKGARPAANFLRSLYRERRLTASELNARLRALDTLASGKLPPPLQHPDTPIGPKGRPRPAGYPARPESRGEQTRGVGTAAHTLGRRGRPPRESRSSP